LRLLVSFLLVAVGSVASAQIASGVSAINRSTVLDLLVFLGPGYLAVKLFQWIWTVMKKRAAKANSLRLELVQVGTLIATLVLSLLSGYVAALVVNSLWPDLKLFGYLKDTPPIDGFLFVSLLIHTVVAMVLAALLALLFGWLDNRNSWVPVPNKKPWAKLWEDEYDSERHVVHVTLGKAAYIGELSHVDSSGESRDLVLEGPHQYFAATGETEPVGEYMLLRDVQAHQVRLIDLKAERELIESQGGLEALGAEDDDLDGEYGEEHDAQGEKPYSGGGGDA